LTHIDAKTPSRLPVSLIVTSILILTVAGSSIPLSNALIQGDHTYLNDNPITASTGNTKVCGDHLCAPGEWEKLQDARSTAQQEHNIVNSTQLGTKDAVPSSTMGDPQTISLDQISQPVPGTPYPIPSPIPVPNPGPSSSLKPLPNQASAYVKTDKPYYELGVQQGTLVHIYGQIPSLQNGMVTINVKTPYSTYKVITTYTDASGSFSAPYMVGFSSPAGQYDITADYSGGEVSGIFFVMRS
jgi:hypothetical protein